MTTYVVLPRPTGEAMEAAQDDDPEAALTAVAEARAAQLFPKRSQSITVSSSLFLADEGGASPPGRVQVLDGLNVYLVDDLDPDEQANLAGIADVLENIEVVSVPPVATSAEDGGLPWHLEDMNANAAWDQGFTGNDIRIGIMDTGIDPHHPEFAGKDISFMEFDSSGFPMTSQPHDAGDHGTHVAGIATGATCGVAPAADLAVAAVLTNRRPDGQMSGYLAQILAGYNWLVHNNHDTTGGISKCTVANASLGGPGFHDYLYSSVEMQLATLRTSLLVAAIGNAGNSGVDHHASPANYDIAAGIGAVDSVGIVASFSDWGLETNHMALKPDLCAPGVDIRSAVPGGGYATKSGTSMASPAAAAAAGLLVQKYPRYARNPRSLKAALLALVDPSAVTHPANTAGGHSRLGSGKLDLSRI